MDMHVHLQGELGPNNEKETLKMSSQLMQMRSIHFAMKTLMAGFTTVRDVGSSGQEMFAMRDAIDRGWIDGPRIIAAGGVGITGGHADISGVKPELLELWTDDSICNGPYDCRRAARNAIKFGADLIKITSTGGVLTDRATGTGQQMEMDEKKTASSRRSKPAWPALSMAPIPGRVPSSCSRKPARISYRRCSPARRLATWPWNPAS
jgi:imidazolonepropionase-like amidohydrolase